ncbi:MAG: hypothetical protein ACE5G8_07575 [Anaerolineae bacterium]
MPNPKMGRAKNIFFYAILVIWIYLSSELAALAGYYIINGEPFSWSQFQSQRLAIMQSDTPQIAQSDSSDTTGEVVVGKAQQAVQVVHPYVGYVLDPTTMDGVSDYGFLDERDPISPQSDDTVTVAIFGGSFAMGEAFLAQDTLADRLKELPQFRDKAFIVHNMAMGGYKQPQQLLALSYFLALGAHFDVVINLDGFNEVALPAYENTPKGVNPFFPRNWYGRVNGFRDPAMLKMIGQVSYLAERQKTWAATFAAPPLRYSVIGNIVWLYRNNTLARQQAEQEAAFNDYEIEAKDTLSYLVTGPSFNYQNDPELYQDLARVWRRSSEQMHRLCLENGCEYFHFLQPNQYVANSKIMGARELKIAVKDGNPYQEGVVQGYPYLIEEGHTLNTEGVRFYDLTMIFATNDEPLYIDRCCHLNKKGYEIVANTIAEFIQQELE